MDHLSRQGFLKYACIGRLYIVEDTIFVSPTRRAVLATQEIGSFTQHVKSYANQAANLPSLYFESEMVSLASRFAARLSEMQFCLTELIPALHNRHPPTAEAFRLSTDVDELLANLARKRAQFQSCAPNVLVESRIASELGRQLRPPCAIYGDTLMPIKELPRSKDRRDRLCIAGKHYLLDLAQAKPMSDIYQAIRQRVTTDGISAEETREQLTATAESVVDDARQLLALFPATACGPMQVIYKDACHQLQHNGRGDFVLVRGPLRHSLDEGSLFVGLPIKGKSRRQWLTVSPTVAREASDFWTAQSQPANFPICMGSAQQYAHLMSPQFTPAEAVVQWLDAGVIVATARPEFHSLWRSEARASRWARRLAPRRGARHNA